MPCLHAAFAVFPGFFGEGPRRWTGQGVGSCGAVGVSSPGDVQPQQQRAANFWIFFFLFVK